MPLENPLDQAASCVSIITGSIMSANWDEHPQQFHIALDRANALRSFIDGLRALDNVCRGGNNERSSNNESCSCNCRSRS